MRGEWSQHFTLRLCIHSLCTNIHVTYSNYYVNTEMIGMIENKRCEWWINARSSANRFGRSDDGIMLFKEAKRIHPFLEDIHIHKCDDDVSEIIQLIVIFWYQFLFSHHQKLLNLGYLCGKVSLWLSIWFSVG